ncbi:hypothetical protein SKAU_G00376600 [Synaphobranchus kaupii]|uniref:Uncharacterized protein n=1 Tax=Synaphobranchus kaupii TaxID=118154 RepID=A0A9Q1ECV9_SYNKA|nr:hypothetical protein SKAU_G00376600 [Synaphobranchus kaupii]
MTNCVHFQTQITTIMEIMTKSAIAEITKLFDDSSSVLCFKISRSLNENEALKKKLQSLQRELRTARGQKEGRAGARESPVNARSVGVQVFVEEQNRERVFGQEWSFSLRGDGEHTDVQEKDAPLQSFLTRNQSTNMEQFRPEPFLIKQERLEEDPQPTPVENVMKLDTEPTPVGDPEELNEQHRCGHGGDEELSEVEFVVKAEQEEEHTQLVSAMEILAKAAVAEINRRVDDSCAVFRVEISQSQKEIETLKRKLQVVERELMKTRRKKTVCSPTRAEHSPPVEGAFGQEWRFRLLRRGEPIAVVEMDTPLQSRIRNQFRPEPPLVKKERLEEDLCYNPEELSEQHRCGHGDEELSEVEFVVKAEQEEEHVAQRLNQTGCEHSAGRLNNLGSEEEGEDSKEAWLQGETVQLYTLWKEF